ATRSSPPPQQPELWLDDRGCEDCEDQHGNDDVEEQAHAARPRLGVDQSGGCDKGNCRQPDEQSYPLRRADKLSCVTSETGGRNQEIAICQSASDEMMLSTTIRTAGSDMQHDADDDEAEHQKRAPRRYEVHISRNDWDKKR